MQSGALNVDPLPQKKIQVKQVIPNKLNMNQYHFIQPGLKDQQDLII